MNIHFQNNTYEWETPQDLFDELDNEFGFEIDVCATEENAKCDKYYSPIQDGLSQIWEGICWMNPPYGYGIKRWMKKAYESSLKGATVVCLVPSRTDTVWWHKHAMMGEVRFIMGRVKFGGGNSNAPFPSAIIIFRPNTQVKRKTYLGFYQQMGLF